MGGTATQTNFLLLSFILCASRWKLRVEMLHLRSYLSGETTAAVGSGSAGLVHSLASGQIKRICWRETLRWPGLLASPSLPLCPPAQKHISHAVTLLLPDAPAVLPMFTALLSVGPFAFCLGTSFSLQQLFYRRARVGTRAELVLVKGSFSPAHSFCLRGQWGGEASPRGGAQGKA